MRREQARYAISRVLSRRRGCALIQVSRANPGYVSRMSGKNAPVVQTMPRPSGDYPRFGSRRIHIMLGRECIVVGKALEPVVGAVRLQVPRKRRRRRVAGSPAATCTADAQCRVEPRLCL